MTRLFPTSPAFQSFAAALCGFGLLVAALVLFPAGAAYAAQDAVTGNAPRNLWNPITLLFQALLGSLATVAILIGAGFKTGAGPFVQMHEKGNTWIARGLKGYAFGLMATLTYYVIVG